MKCKFLSTFTHAFFPHFVVTLKDWSFHFGVPNENEWSGTYYNDKRMLNKRWVQGEGFLKAQWALCEGWVRTDQRAQVKAWWVHCEGRVNAQRNGKVESFRDCKILKLLPYLVFLMLDFFSGETVCQTFYIIVLYLLWM